MKFFITTLLVMMISFTLFSSENSKKKITEVEKKVEKSGFEGTKIKVFTLKNHKNRFFFLSRLLKKSKKDYIFLTFFTNSCKNCKKERSILKEISKKHKNFETVYIAIREADDDGESISEFQKNAKKIMKEETLDHVLMDVYNVVSKSYKINSVPRLIVIERKTGTIIKDLTGYHKDLDQIYQKIMNKLN